MNSEISIYAYKNYVTYLNDILVSKRNRDLSYSQKDFADELGMKAPRINQVLKGKEGISVQKAMQLSEKLDLSSKEKEYFFHLVSASTAKSADQKEKSKDFVIQNYRPHIPNYVNLKDWSLLDLEGWDTIWSLIDVNSDFSDLNKISKIVKITVDEIDLILKKYEELGFIKFEDNQIIKLKRWPTFGNSISSKSIRDHHKNKLIGALRALDHQGMETRKNESLTFSLKKSQFEELSLKVEKFVDNFLNEQDLNDHDDVATLTICLYNSLK